MFQKANRYKWALLIFIMGMGYGLKAQTSLEGKVLDAETNSAIPGALVQLPELKRTTITDTAGHYIFSNLADGKVQLLVEMSGYGIKNLFVVLSGVTKRDVFMEGTHMELKQVIVTGSPYATDITKSPVQAVLVNKEYLRQNSGTNIIDAFAKTPGISQISTGAAISKPMIRGLGYNRIITLNDGIRQEGQQWGDEHGIEVDEYGVDRIEILKGPASLMYGPDGLAGVINLLPPLPQPEGKIAGELSSNYQTNNGLYGYSGLFAGNLKGFVWSGRYSSKNAHSYKNPNDGYVYNSGSRERDANGFIGFHRHWGYTHLNFSAFTQELGLPEGERDSVTGKFIRPLTDSTTEIVSGKNLKSYTFGIPRQKIEHYRVYSTSKIMLGDSRLGFHFAYQQNIRKEFGEISNPEQAGLYLKLHTFNYDAKFSLPERKGWNSSFGLNGMLQKNENLGTEFLIPDYSLADAGLFAFVQKSFKKLNLSGGIRYDVRSLSGQSLWLDSNENRVAANVPGGKELFKSLDRTFQNYTGSIGMTYQLNPKLLLKANVSRGFRPPNIAELSSNGIHEGTFRYELGNAGMKAESSLQQDLSLTFNNKHITLDVAGFNNNISNFIYVNKLQSQTLKGGDSFPDPANTIPAYGFIQGQAWLYGGEISMDIHPHPLDWLHLENSLSIVHGINLSQEAQPDARYLPFIPPMRSNSEILAMMKGRFHFLKKAYAKIEYEYYFAQKEILSQNKTETPSPAYGLIHAGLGTDIINKGGKVIFSLNFSINNLGNTAYQYHLSRLRYAPENFASGRLGIYNMGRNFSFKLTVPVSFR